MTSTDRQALIALYNATGGAEWHRSENWNTDADVQLWYGVQVRWGRVVQLGLSYNRLRGTIPKELGKLLALEDIYLHRNNLSGPIPKELGALSELKKLCLHGNKLTGHIPKELGDLSSIDTLSLQANQLSGPIPPELGNLPVLQLIDLESNCLSGPIPPELGNLAALVRMNLGINELSGPIPKKLGKLTAVKYLTLQRNNLSGRIPVELGDLHDLERLNLQKNILSGPLPPQLGNLSALDSLELSENELDGPIPKELGALTKLTQLLLSRNRLSGPIPKELGALTKLTQLLLSRNRLTGSVPAQFVKLNRLCELGLEGNQLSDHVPSADQLKDLYHVLARSSPHPRDYDNAASFARRMTTAASRPPKAGEESVDSIKTTITDRLSKGENNQLKMMHASHRRTEEVVGDEPATVMGDRMSAISDFKGHVIAWCFGPNPHVLRDEDAEFELEVPALGRNVPALIGLCSSSAEVVNGQQCLLHPIVTCVAQAGETFNPPLRLRFPVGDVESMESGSVESVESSSDCGTPDDAEVAYRAHLESTFSAWTREDAHSEWVPINGSIEQVKGGGFVLEVKVSHFCDFTLKRNINVGVGGIELVKLDKLRHTSRRSHFHFVHLGAEKLVVYGWGPPRRKGFTEQFKVSVGLGLTSANAGLEGTRALEDVPDGRVEKVDVYGKPFGKPRDVACLVCDDRESLTVAHVTQETIRSRMGGTHKLIQVWGSRSMQHKLAMVFGPLPTDSECLVSNLKVEDGDNVGKVVKSRVA